MIPALPSVNAPDTAPSTAIHTLVGSTAIKAIAKGCEPKITCVREKINAMKKVIMSYRGASRFILAPSIECFRVFIIPDPRLKPFSPSRFVLSIVKNSFP